MSTPTDTTKNQWSYSMEMPYTFGLPRKQWTYAELEALYPQDFPRWKRTTSPYGGFLMLYAASISGFMQIVSLLFGSPSATFPEIGVRLAAVVGTVALAKTGIWLFKQPQKTDEIFVERLKSVDTESLIRWYQSRQCLSSTVLYGVIAKRGIHLRL